MAENIDLVLEFLKKNRFAKAEAALRGELSATTNGQRRAAEPSPKEEDERDGLHRRAERRRFFREERRLVQGVHCQGD